MPRRTFKRRSSGRRSFKRSGFRKRTFRGRGRRISRKRGFRATKRINIKTQFPTVCFRTFKWADTSTNARTMTITGAGATSYGDQTIYLWNTLYAPNVNVAGPASMGSLQEMTSLYNACRVMAVKVTSNFFYNATQLTNSVFQPIKCYIAGNPYGQTLTTPANNTNWAGIEQYINANPKYCTYGFLQSFGGNKTVVKLKKYWNLADYYGNKAEWNAITGADQPVPSSSGSNPLTSNPTTTLGGAIGINVVDDVLPTVAITITCDTVIKFYTKWWNPKGQTN